MRTSSILAAISLIASSFAQGPPEGVAPPDPSPPGCEDTATGKFTIGTLLLSSKHKRESAQEVAVNTFVCSLNEGILHDPQNRTGSIVANYQFQFDGPPQAGAIWTGGWSVCKNNSLAIGPNTTFWHCLSGGFANLYSVNLGAQCSPINIVVSYVDKPSSSSSVVASTATATATETSSGGVESASSSASISATATGSSNETISTGVPSSFTSVPASATSVPVAPDAGGASSTSGSTGGAIPTRVPRRETFGAVIGILGAALIL
ncbi:hypothetical protein K505DRAFT_235702 [Melanomma pulvis-pyrius CBS 109.77]|uniref:Cell wall mannoprotein PIR1-like C-terminal domain-containing protein n=1 Tax=Melanomma pulvis-pyrius CBS 109.77 TaxID=1314802 RepID=A0A6A6XLZ5_9PLEO|nr:hypothetical protein K505DRAFT_235702 [Melanomma pulvis-pyrius CBS 109.77]